jgi:hypothetical protein
MRNYVTKLRYETMLWNYVTKLHYELRYEITLRNYITKLLRETKKNRHYVTFWRSRNHEVKIEVYIVKKNHLMVVSAVSFN